MKLIQIEDPVILLCQLLKIIFPNMSGGEAKLKIQSGHIQVNGEITKAKKLKIKENSKVFIDGIVYQIVHRKI